MDAIHQVRQITLYRYKIMNLKSIEAHITLQDFWVYAVRLYVCTGRGREQGLIYGRNIATQSTELAERGRRLQLISLSARHFASLVASQRRRRHHDRRIARSRRLSALATCRRFRCRIRRGTPRRSRPVAAVMPFVAFCAATPPRAPPGLSTRYVPPGLRAGWRHNLDPSAPPLGDRSPSVSGQSHMLNGWLLAAAVPMVCCM